MEVEVVGVLFDALLDKPLGIFVFFEFDKRAEEHLVVELVGGAGIEGFVAFGRLLELAAGIIMCGQLFLRLLRMAGDEEAEHESHTHQPPLMVQDRCHEHYHL